MCFWDCVIPFLDIQAYEPAPETPYDTIIVIREYDAAADIPDDLTNVLAVVNAKGHARGQEQWRQR